jgi:hypothetical protein
MVRAQVLKVALLSVVVVFAGRTNIYTYQRPPVCANVELRRAIRSINDACTDITCDFSKLRELDDIDKGKLLAALRNPYLRPVHLFFPKGQTQLSDAFDWRTTKKDQLDSIKYIDDPDNTIVFVIGRASATGNRDVNIRLSRERMLSVMDYVRNHLQVKCHKFKGGWLGKDYLQLSRSDATLLNVESRDYREDELILNQAVHVFVFPCRDVL